MEQDRRELHIVLDGNNPNARFVEIEDENGKSVRVGRWEKRGRYWHIVIPAVYRPVPTSS